MIYPSCHLSDRSRECIELSISDMMSKEKYRNLFLIEWREEWPSARFIDDDIDRICFFVLLVPEPSKYPDRMIRILANDTDTISMLFAMSSCETTGKPSDRMS